MKSFLNRCFYHKSGQDDAVPDMVAGQAMFVSVLAIGGTILGVTTIAGLFMVYQLRQTGDFTNSAKAIFAADAGIEAILYNQFKCPTDPCPVLSQPTFTNGAELTLTCYKKNSGVVSCYDYASYHSNNPNNVIRFVEAKGRGGNSYRAFVQPL